jgi:hypothetical protein
MKLVELEEAVSNHSGVFQCTGRGGEKSISKIINFEHKYESPRSFSDVPDIGMLKEFYSTFSSLTLYHHKESEDAAFYIASPEEWDTLQEDFSGWKVLMRKRKKSCFLNGSITLLQSVKFPLRVIIY